MRQLFFPSELAIWQPFGAHWPYASYRLALYYDEIIYGQPSPPFEAAALLLHGVTVALPEYRRALSKITTLSSLPLSELIKVAALPVDVCEAWDGATTPWMLGKELAYSRRRSLDVLVPYDLFDDVCRYLMKDASALARLKKTHLKWEILNHLLAIEVPGFSVDIRAKNSVLRACRPAFASFVDEAVQGEAGYELTLPLKERVERTLAERRRLLDRIAGTGRLGQLTPSLEEVVRAVTSEVAGSVIPFSGALINGLKRLLDAHAVRKEGLGVVIALSLIRATHASPPIATVPCKIGELSVPEIEAAEPFSLFGDMCMGHRIAYLTGRKVHHLVDKDLLLFMKQASCSPT